MEHTANSNMKIVSINYFVGDERIINHAICFFDKKIIIIKHDEYQRGKRQNPNPYNVLFTLKTNFSLMSIIDATYIDNFIKIIYVDGTIDIYKILEKCIMCTYQKIDTNKKILKINGEHPFKMLHIMAKKQLLNGLLCIKKISNKNKIQLPKPIIMMILELSLFGKQGSTQENNIITNDIESNEKKKFAKRKLIKKKLFKTKLFKKKLFKKKLFKKKLFKKKLVEKKTHRKETH